MRTEHEEQIERWGEYVRQNPDKWKMQLKKFLDSQIIIANRAFEKLSQTQEGREKIRELKSIKM